MTTIWKESAKGTVPADYSREDDPLDVQGMAHLLEELQTDWAEGSYDERTGQIIPTDRAKQAVANAMRAALLSPQTKLWWNAAAYQHIKDIPYTITDPKVYFETLEKGKAAWDADVSPEQENKLKRQLHEKGYWNAAAESMAQISANIDDITWFALEDLWEYGATGYAWRENMTAAKKDLGLRGYGMKILSFAWLLLQPTTSQLATLDTWMLSDVLMPQLQNPEIAKALQLKVDQEKRQNPFAGNDKAVCPRCGSPHVLHRRGQSYRCQECGNDFKVESQSSLSDAQYLMAENQLRELKDSKGYRDVPLGNYQWAEWDYARTGPGYRERKDRVLAEQPGYHQDHSPLRVEDPVGVTDIEWGGVGTNFNTYTPTPWEQHYNWQLDVVKRNTPWWEWPDELRKRYKPEWQALRAENPKRLPNDQLRLDDERAAAWRDEPSWTTERNWSESWLAWED